MNLKHDFLVAKRTIDEIALNAQTKEFRKISHLFSCLFQHFLKGAPYNVTIEPSNTCNLKCEFCSSPYWLMKREKKFLTLSEFKKLVLEIKPKTHYLWLFLGGEPFLNPNFSKMCAFASENNLHVATSTNATLFKKKGIEEIVKAKTDQIIISLDGATKKTYEAMRKNGKFEKTIENIKMLVEEKSKQKSLKPFIELQMIVTKINSHEKEKFKELAKELGVNKVTFKSLAIPTWIYNEKESKQLQKNYLLEKGKTRYSLKKSGFNDLAVKQFGKCPFAKRSIVFSNGTVSMCCYDLDGKYNFGNALINGFENVWKSEKYKKSRPLIANRSFELCRTCGQTDDL